MGYYKLGNGESVELDFENDNMCLVGDYTEEQRKIFIVRFNEVQRAINGVELPLDFGKRIEG